MSEITSTPSGADGETPFELQYFPPDPDLAEMVSSFYFVRIDMPVFDEYERADRPQFRIMSTTAGEYVFPDGHCFPAARATIIGPTSVPRPPTATQITASIEKAGANSLGLMMPTCGT